MSDKKLDWKLIGQCVAVVVRLFGTITAAFKKLAVGPEILDWLDGSGRDYFKRKLEEVALEYKRQTTPIPRKEIDLDVNPTLPFGGATIKKHIGGGKMAVIEKRIDGVYLDGKKLTLHRSERQINGKTIQGYELLLEVENLPVHNATLNDFFVKNLAFVPEDWKMGADGNTVYIFFWGSLFLSPPDGRVYVRCGYWRDNCWVSGCRWIDIRFHSGYPAVVSEGDRAV